MIKQHDAVDLLQAGHRDIKGLFEAFKSMCLRDTTGVEKAALAGAICISLSIHAQVEEEIFYPALREAVGDDAMLDEAEVEHLAVKDQIARISAMQPADTLFDARVSVLAALVGRHLQAEEADIFPLARASNVDLIALGATMQARKSALLAEFKDLAGGAGGSGAVSRPAAGAAPAAKGLAQQQADFTAEGAPPPGKVGLSAPESSSDGADARSIRRARSFSTAIGAHRHWNRRQVAAVPA